MLWRSGITDREPALLVRLDCAIMYRAPHATSHVSLSHLGSIAPRVDAVGDRLQLQWRFSAMS